MKSNQLGSMYITLILSLLLQATRSDFGAIGSSGLGWLADELSEELPSSFVDTSSFDFDLYFPFSTSLGLQLNKDLTISNMEDSKAAELTGMLQLGDMLISINGEDLSSTSYVQTVQKLNELQTKHSWFWLRFRPSRLQVRHRVELYDHNMTVTLKDEEGERLGLMLSSGLKVFAIVEGSPMWSDGIVQQGNILISIGDEIVTGQSLNEVSDILQSVTGPINLRFRVSLEERKKRRSSRSKLLQQDIASKTETEKSKRIQSWQSETNTTTYTVIFDTLQDLGIVLNEVDLSVVGFSTSRDGGSSPAEQDGRVHMGDIIVSVDNEEMKTAKIANKRLGQKTKQEVLRCRGGKVTRYCAIERVEPKTTLRTVVLRHGPKHYQRIKMLPSQNSQNSQPSQSEKVQLELELESNNAVANPNEENIPGKEDSIIAKTPTAASTDSMESRYMGARKKAMENSRTAKTMLMPSGIHEHVFRTTRGFARGTNISMDFSNSLFGGPIPCESHRLIVAEPMDGCRELLNLPDDVRNAYVVVRRGGCFFSSKAINVQYAGGAGLIVIDNVKRNVYGKKMDSKNKLHKLHQQALPDRMPANANDGHLVKIAAIAIDYIAGERLLNVLKQELDNRLRLSPENPDLCPTTFENTLPQQEDDPEVESHAIGSL